ncbi:PQ-loop-domain-containing protein [Exidia glandulosa HHB12029]|uniref:PQ-loop-domain-containing protein n=1 Tax=Exidia glandulosa HHB12029 TaxID=1314781 RepID=A0A165FFZ7_EXIGL|nr:PQ-loop-domain-containing protein [Exidia glandulosa HHB12029]
MPPNAASSVLGWVSIACWVIVYSPQILENYTLKSGEGLSVLFVVIWLLGDLFNLLGAILAGLLATVIILAAYYTLCDVILLFQIYYYRAAHPVHRISPVPIPGVVLSTEHGETSPLLSPTLPPADSLKQPEHTPVARRVVMYIAALGFVVGTGFAAWWLFPTTKHHGDETGSGKVVFEIRSQVLGWTSAALYLGSRIPQIVKNRETKCEGLSLALFIFAIAGNVTYVASILAASLARDHLIANASWLAGSGGTVFLDFIVLGQFFYYRRAERVFLTDGQLERARTRTGGVEDRDVERVHYDS